MVIYFIQINVAVVLPFDVIREVGQQLHDVTEDGVAELVATDVAPAEDDRLHGLPTAEETVTELV